MEFFFSDLHIFLGNEGTQLLRTSGNPFTKDRERNKNKKITPNLSIERKKENTVSMAAKYIIGSIAGSFVIAYACDVLIAEKKIFGGSTPRTVADKEWWQATDKKFQAWPRTAGPPVVMNPITRQNFIVKDPET